MGNDVVGNKVTPVLELDSSDRDIQAVKDENNEFPLCGSVLFGLSEETDTCDGFSLRVQPRLHAKETLSCCVPPD